jgi:hypothetical protein
MILAVLLGVGLAQASPAPLSSAPIPWVRPTPTPVVWDGPPAARFAVMLEPLDLSPEGEARVLVRVRFFDAGGRETHLLRGGDFDYFPSRGTAQWQTRLRYRGPAAIVRIGTPGSLDVRVVADKPTGLGSVRAHLAASMLAVPASVARAIGPHEVQLGFFPALPPSGARIERYAKDGPVQIVATFAKQTATFRDFNVEPNKSYRYRIKIGSRIVGNHDVETPPDVPRSTANLVRGLGAWVAFSGSARDDDSYVRLDPQRTIATARRVGLRYLMLRLTYGEFWEITPEAKPTIDRLIDEAAAAGIPILAWTVPRESTAEDVATNVRALTYRTAAGNGMSGLAVDLERGEEFLGNGARGYHALETYLGRVRSAVGAGVLLVATVEDPYLSKLDNQLFPYRTIARSADVLQPMTYWRMLRPSATLERMRDAISESIRTLRAVSASDVPINLGGQTVALSRSGGPPPTEVAASIAEARRLGAIGESFYTWIGTTDAQWDAIARTPW